MLLLRETGKLPKVRLERKQLRNNEGCQLYRYLHWGSKLGLAQLQVILNGMIMAAGWNNWMMVMRES